MHDVVVVGGGTAGCVLAARLSENPDCDVMLLEAGPDYGPLADGRWPSDILDARRLPETHNWEPAGEDQRTLGGRIIGGSSAINACMVVAGSPADYDEWGPDWSHMAPFLDRARAMLRTASANTAVPPPFYDAFLEAARATGLDAAPYPANVVDGCRWNAALAYLDPARGRPNLEIVGDTLVDRVLLQGSRATVVVCADGAEHRAEMVILAAGAYFSPAILLRSDMGPGLAVDLPVGERLLDHCGTSLAWEATELLDRDTADHARTHGLYEAHAFATAASSNCPPGEWDLHILPWIFPADVSGRFNVSMAAFHVKPLSSGRLTLRSTDPAALPLVERGFLSNEEDVSTIVEGLELARTIAGVAPMQELLGPELRPGDVELDEFVRSTVRNYFHPAGTCAIGEVVDPSCRVLGVEGLLVADASIMPTIPRANTNLTTAAIAERVAETLK
jgi:choline dehydrogenase